MNTTAHPATASGAWTLPPEWAPQQALQLTWPHAGTDWNYCLDDILHTYVEMAEAVTRFQRLIIVAPDVNEVERTLRPQLSEEAWQRVTLHQCPTNDTWARDHALITLTAAKNDNPLTAANTDARHRLLDFRFNGWGEKFEADKDNAINRSLFENGVVKGAYEDHDDFVLEGGSIEADGHGTVFTTSCCLLAPHRNQPLSREEIEQQLLQRLHAQRILWIDHGSLEGDDTDGHIDTLVRTAPDYTLLYIRCDDPNDAHYAPLQAMERQLASFRTPEGKPYRLLPLPMAPALYEDDYRLPATYANFVIINGAVIYPTYDCPETDRLAAEAIAKAFPGRQLIGIDSRTVVRQHGSLHCCTMQYPE